MSVLSGIADAVSRRSGETASVAVALGAAAAFERGDRRYGRVLLVRLLTPRKDGVAAVERLTPVERTALREEANRLRRLGNAEGRSAPGSRPMLRAAASDLIAVAVAITRGIDTTATIKLAFVATDHTIDAEQMMVRSKEVIGQHGGWSGPMIDVAIIGTIGV